MSRPRGETWTLLLSVLLALLAGLAALPSGWEPLRPLWIGMVLIYWALEAPERAGLGLAFLCGLWADVLSGTVLGEHALRLCILVFLVARFRPRLRFFPVVQQSLAVALLLLNDRVVALGLRLMLGEGAPPLSFWASPLAGALCWPWLYLALDRWRMRWRYRHD